MLSAALQLDRVAVSHGSGAELEIIEGAVVWIGAAASALLGVG